MMMKMQFFSPIKQTDRRADFAIAFWHLKGYCKWLIDETVAAKFNTCAKSYGWHQTSGV